MVNTVRRLLILCSAVSTRKLKRSERFRKVEEETQLEVKLFEMDKEPETIEAATHVPVTLVG